MSRINYQSKLEGHRVEGPSNRDLEQKLTYQQLLNLNHDLSKENQQLKTISQRLGSELKSLHQQFQIKPREENTELYNAINSHPTLHQYQLTLIPLLDAYEVKMQQFENGFENINDQFVLLQKKYEEVCQQNQSLRTQLTQKIQQLVKVYQQGSSERLGADFSQIILQQINQKQKFLTEENGRLQREAQKAKSEAEKYSRQLTDLKKRQQDSSTKIKGYEFNLRQLQAQIKNLKDVSYKSQLKSSDLENDKKKLQNDLQRATSQIVQLNKDRDAIYRNYQSLKHRYQSDVNATYYEEDKKTNDWNRTYEENKSNNSNEDSKKLGRLQKQYDSLNKEKSKLKEQLEQYKLNLEESNIKIGQLKKKMDTIENQKRSLEVSQAKNRKMLESLNEKVLSDTQRLKRQHEQELRRNEEDFYSKLEMKQKKLLQIQESLDKIKLQRDKLEQQNIIHTSLSKQGGKNNKNKDGDRMAEKLKEKIAINEELFKEQIQILQNDNIYLKKEADTYKIQSKQRGQNLRKTTQQVQKLKRQVIENEERHHLIIEEIKRVKNEYEGNLRQKERLFDQKIRQIKSVVEQSDKKRKSEREKVGQASRQYKRVLEQIKNSYEERIRVLETDLSNSKVKKGQAFC